jgi:hypothetical protein
MAISLRLHNDFRRKTGVGDQIGTAEKCQYHDCPSNNFQSAHVRSPAILLAQPKWPSLIFLVRAWLVAYSQVLARIDWWWPSVTIARLRTVLGRVTRQTQAPCGGNGLPRILRPQL